MTIKHADWKGLRRSKSKTLRYGKRSIYDIIKDTELDFADKVDYIRHHYVYYEGNYEYFHDERGKSNGKKEELNQLISLIIQRLVDPSELRIINQDILLWRKAKKLAEKQAREEAIAKFNGNFTKSPYEMKVDTWFSNWIQIYDYSKLAVMREYLLAHNEMYKNEHLETYNYKELKIKAFSWKNHKLQLEKQEQEKNNIDNIIQFDEAKLKQQANNNGENNAATI